MSDHYEPPPPYEARSSDSIVPQIPAASPPLLSPASAVSSSSSSAPRSLVSPSSTNDPRTFLSAGPSLESKALWSTSTPGDIDIWLNLRDRLPDLPTEPIASVREYAIDFVGDIPSLNIVMFAVGPAGDVQPFISLAGYLALRHGHNVRIATHTSHKNDVETTAGEVERKLGGKDGLAGKRLRYFPIPDLMGDGNPVSWSQNPSELKETLSSLYRSTFQPDDDGTPFAPDLIVSNPLSLGHVHIAEWCGVPLHILSTSPASPTTTLSHPGTSVKQSNAEKGLTNYLSYALVENLLWRELGGVINSLRATELALPTLNGTSGPGALDRLKIPFSYTWSQNILPKPEDWAEHIDVTGFITKKRQEQALDNELVYFLKEGRAPIYVCLDLTSRPDVAKNVLTAVTTAVRQINARAVIHVPGAEMNETHADLFIIPGKANPPSEWLLTDERVSAVIHDGDAGIYATAIQAGIPSIVMHSTGGVGFLSSHIANLRAGVHSLDMNTVDAETLISALEQIMTPELKLAARELGWQTRSEDGIGEAAKSIHRHLPLLTMKCDIIPSQVALWYYPELCMRLSASAASVLVEVGKLEYKQLLPNRPREYPVSLVVTDPATGGMQSFFTALTNSVASVVHLFGTKVISLTVDLSVQQLAAAARETAPSLSIGWTWEYETPGRVRGPVTDVKSGMKEAKEEMMASMRDGVKGLVMEPWRGLKRAGPIGGVLGVVHGSMGLVTRPLAGSVRAMGISAQGAASEMKAGSSRRRAGFDSSDALRIPRRQMSEQAAKLLDVDDKRRILAAYKKAKVPASVLARQERLESVLRGMDVKPNHDAGVILGGDEGRTGESSQTCEKVENKWWKGKGKAKEEPKKTASGSARKSKEAEAKAEAEAEAKRRGISGSGGEQ